MKKLLFVSLISFFVLTSCNTSIQTLETAKTGAIIPATPSTEVKNVELSNTASKNCIDTGGEIVIKESPNGQYGVCVFEDNRQCEEWALIRQNCPTGGLKITGYETDAQVFCAITGGKLSMESSPIMCTLPANQGECSADDYFTKGVSCVVKQ